MAKRALQPSTEQGRIDFRDQAFKDKVIQKGYDITWAKMILCPCRKDISTQPISSCINCSGTGYVWIDALNIIGMISNTAVQKRFIQWTEDLAGSAYLTVNPEHRVGWMDKITVTSAETMYSEVCEVFLETGVYYIRSRYPVLELVSTFLFINAETTLDPIAPSNITLLGNNRIRFDGESLTAGNNITILYKHHPVYLVIDSLNDYRNSYVRRGQPQDTNKKLPIRVMLKKAHLVL